MSMTMTVDRDGIPPWSRFNWEEAAAAWAEDVTPLAGMALRGRAPFRTGAFRQSIDDRAQVEPGVATVMFYSQVPYAKWIIGGTRAHPIAAVNAKALRWLGPGGIGANYAKRVQHPGTKANEFAEVALLPIGPLLSRMFADAVKEAMKI